MKNCILVSFGGRKNGNCSTILSYIKNEYLNDNIKHELIDVLDLSIEPCGNCEYMCFKEKCCKNDDVDMLYNKLISADLVIMCIPVFGNHLCSKYFAFNERGQGIWQSDEAYINFLEKTFLIGVGNKSNTNLFDKELNLIFDEYSIKNHTIILSSCDFGISSIRDRFVDNDECLNKIKNFIKKIDMEI